MSTLGPLVPRDFRSKLRTPCLNIMQFLSTLTSALRLSLSVPPQSRLTSALRAEATTLAEMPEVMMQATEGAVEVMEGEVEVERAVEETVEVEVVVEETVEVAVETEKLVG